MGFTSRGINPKGTKSNNLRDWTNETTETLIN